MSIATKKGDEGETSLIYGRRVSKNHPRVWAYGSVDELNSVLGLCRSHGADGRVERFIHSVQMDLIQIMGELACAEDARERYLERAESPICEAHIDRLDKQIIAYEAEAGRFSGWEVPGSSPVQAFFDQARTFCRRAERYVVAVRESGENVRPEILRYLNRLSDLLWLIGRTQSESDSTAPTKPL